MRLLLATATTVLLISLAPSSAAQGALDEGLAAFQAGDEEEAVRLLLPLAEGGDVEAQFFVGMAYDSEEGVPRDEATAAEWYRRSGEQGHPGGRLYYALFLENGWGVEQDVSRAATLYQEVAEDLPDVAGTSVFAKYQLAELYYRGSNTARDPEQAARWYRAAAEAGHSDAQRTLALMRLEGDGVEADTTAAADALRSGAAQGDAEAACLLSNLLIDSPAVEGGIGEGYVWGRLSAERGACEAFDEAATRALLSEQERQGADALYAEVSQLWRIWDMRRGGR